MNVRALRQAIMNLDDDIELAFAIDGEVLPIGAILAVPEWNEVYFGVDSQDVSETLMEYEAEIDKPIEDREDFMRALAEAEDADWVESCAVEGLTCAMPAPKPSPLDEECTEAM